MAISPNGYTDDFGPNVSAILSQGARLIRGKVPASVRSQLRAAVNAGVLGRLPKNGLKPEAYFHPNNRNTAVWMRDAEAAHATRCIAKCVGANTDLQFSSLRKPA